MGRQLGGPGDQLSQRRNAGTKSGSVRSKRAEIRRLVVKAAFARLRRPYQVQPYSDEAIDALQAECTKIPSIGLNGDDFDSLVSLLLDGQKITLEVPRETLKKDMKWLGIRSMRTAQRSG